MACGDTVLLGLYAFSGKFSYKCPHQKRKSLPLNSDVICHESLSYKSDTFSPNRQRRHRTLNGPSLLPQQMKTVSVALVLCLNIDVDPPDVLKTSPCARMETWIGERRGLVDPVCFFF